MEVMRALQPESRSQLISKTSAKVAAKISGAGAELISSDSAIQEGRNFCASAANLLRDTTATVWSKNQWPQSGTHSVVHTCVPSGCVWHRISGCIPSGQASSALANLISLSCNPLMPCCDKCSWTFFKMPCACSCVRCLALLIGILSFLVGRCWCWGC